MPFNLRIDRIEAIHLWLNPDSTTNEYPIIVTETEDGGAVNKIHLSRRACAILYEELNTWAMSETLDARAKEEERDGLPNLEHESDVTAFYLANHKTPVKGDE